MHNGNSGERTPTHTHSLLDVVQVQATAATIRGVVGQYNRCVFTEARHSSIERVGREQDRANALEEETTTALECVGE